MSQVKKIQGLSAIISHYRVVLLDIWGVLHDGAKLYPGALGSLKALHESGVKVILVSNAARRCETTMEELVKLGIPRHLIDGLVTSGELVYQALHQGELPSQIRGHSFYYLGPERSRGIVSGLEYREVTKIEEADFIINTGAPGPLDSVDPYLPFLQQAGKKNTPMICANPDLMAIRAGVSGISAGALAAKYEKLSGSFVWWVGKPHELIYQAAMVEAGSHRADSVLAIGDAMNTDITGANRAGVDSLLICSGIHRDDIQVENSAGIRSFLERHECQPTYYCSQLQW